MNPDGPESKTPSSLFETRPSIFHTPDKDRRRDVSTILAGLRAAWTLSRQHPILTIRTDFLLGPVLDELLLPHEAKHDGVVLALLLGAGVGQGLVERLGGPAHIPVADHLVPPFALPPEPAQAFATELLRVGVPLPTPPLRLVGGVFPNRVKTVLAARHRPSPSRTSPKDNKTHPQVSHSKLQA